MDLNDVTKKKEKLEREACLRIQDAIQEFRGDLNKSNEDVKQKLHEMNTEKKESDEDVDGSPPFLPPSPPLIKKPLIYFSYPMSGYSEPPSWVEPLRKVLNSVGYFVYNPWDNIEAQFGQQDLPNLNLLPIKVVKSLCSLLQIPEEVLLPFEAVWQLIKQGDGNDNFGIVFQCLWFLTRSSLVICDLIRPMAGAGTAQEMLYSKQLNIPIIGLLSTSGQLNPFAQRTTTALFNSSDLLALLPMVKGYVPINN